MKTKIFTLLAVAAVMASCSKDEVVSVGAQSAANNMIGFSTYSSLNHTKGAPVNNNTDFAVSGQTFTAAAFLAGVQDAYLTAVIKHDGSKWAYETPSDAEFWPSDKTQTLDFYAHANAAASATVAISKTGIASTGYTIDPAIANQGDFLCSQALDAENVTPSSNVNDGAVKMNFEHALTQINVTAEVTTADYHLLVSSVEFCNVKSVGNLAYPVVSPATRLWSSQATPATFAIANSAASTAISNTTPSAAVAIDNAAGELILLPQTFTAWDGASKASTQNGAYILVTCKFYKTMTAEGGSGNVNIYYIGSSTTEETVAIPLASVADSGTPEAPDATSPEWKEGRNITYNLKFGVDPTNPSKPGGGLDPETGKPVLVPISFTTAVAAWEDITPSTDVEM